MSKHREAPNVTFIAEYLEKKNGNISDRSARKIARLLQELVENPKIRMGSAIMSLGLIALFIGAAPQLSTRLSLNQWTSNLSPKDIQSILDMKEGKVSFKLYFNRLKVAEMHFVKTEDPYTYVAILQSGNARSGDYKTIAGVMSREKLKSLLKEKTKEKKGIGEKIRGFLGRGDEKHSSLRDQGKQQAIKVKRRNV